MVQLDDVRIALGGARLLRVTIETRATLRAEAMLAGNTG
ncbi:hypothetical protein SAMN05216573_107331 [Bradyrhizobium sp. Rc3b]|nr:hypothetical protein [Bradyrhizobium sp. SBR1B]SFN05882.1 hypothetical protein SAMN05216573_107331 [Bradyrhizobium sp. Rc3b]